MATTGRNFWPKGVPDHLHIPQVPLTHYLEVAAARYPDKFAVVYAGRSVSYSQLHERVNALAGYLVQRLGIQQGDRVLLISQNCPQFVVAYYAILRAGAVVVPVNAMSTTSEIRHYLQDSGARVAMVAQELLPTLAPLLQPEDPQGLHSAVVHAYSEALDSDPPDPDLPDAVRVPRQPLTHPGLHAHEEAMACALAPPARHPGPNDLCVLPYTSGTTGHPKGCMHTHASVLAACVSSQIWRGVHAETVFLSSAPLFHMLGMQGGMNTPITLGATVVMLPRWNAATAARLIEHYRVNNWAAPPAMLIDFFAHPDAHARDLSSLSAVGGGGAAMPESVAAILQTRLGIAYVESYGLSETAAFLLGNPPQRGKRQCLGIATPGVDARIVDPETLQELAVGEPGEIVVHGPQVMQGYWQNTAANASAFFERDGKRFFRTGDLGYQDEEGYFFMRDRLKRMVNVSGYKVWPAEVENLLYAHPAIQEACVIAVPDAKQGEAVKALVVLRASHRNLATAHEIVDWARTQMAAYKVPRWLELVDQLPKSNTGKILWRELQEAERQRMTARGSPPAAT